MQLSYSKGRGINFYSSWFLFEQNGIVQNDEGTKRVPSNDETLFTENG